jgi:hypothetical protein
MSFGEGYATEASKAYLDHYWDLERREHTKVVSEGGGEQDDPTSTTDEKKEVKVFGGNHRSRKHKQHECATEMRF